MSVLRFARITLAIVVAGFAMGTIDRAFGLDGLDGEIANVFFIMAAMLLASLSDRELFWATPPKRRR
ncbi:MAG TPA: hypothetical protein VFJ64_03475 [Solirubrobacterales bacterium]|nr:hypothetical protein [Solirubrobacterales bacterium]